MARYSVWVLGGPVFSPSKYWRLTMRTATGARRLETTDDDRTERQWRLGFFIALSCAALVALVAFAQGPPAKALIRPTGPLPAINIP